MIYEKFSEKKKEFSLTFCSWKKLLTERQGVPVKQVCYGAAFIVLCVRKKQVIRVKKTARSVNSKHGSNRPICIILYIHRQSIKSFHTCVNILFMTSRITANIYDNTFVNLDSKV